MRPSTEPWSEVRFPRSDPWPLFRHERRGGASGSGAPWPTTTAPRPVWRTRLSCWPPASTSIYRRSSTTCWLCPAGGTTRCLRRTLPRCAACWGWVEVGRPGQGLPGERPWTGGTQREQVTGTRSCWPPAAGSSQSTCRLKTSIRGSAVISALAARAKVAAGGDCPSPRTLSWWSGTSASGGRGRGGGNARVSNQRWRGTRAKPAELEQQSN